jgi:hypothetical protein
MNKGRFYLPIFNPIFAVFMAYKLQKLFGAPIEIKFPKYILQFPSCKIAKG